MLSEWRFLHPVSVAQKLISILNYSIQRGVFFLSLQLSHFLQILTSFINTAYTYDNYLPSDENKITAQEKQMERYLDKLVQAQSLKGLKERTKP